MSDPNGNTVDNQADSRRSRFDVTAWRGKKRKKKDDDDFPRPSAGAVVVRFLPFLRSPQGGGGFALA